VDEEADKSVDCSRLNWNNSRKVLIWNANWRRSL